MGCRGCGGGQRDARGVWPPYRQLGQREVIRTEIMPPLRYAVCLIDRKESNFSTGEKLHRMGGVETLWRDIEQVEGTGKICTFDNRPLGRGLALVEVGGTHPLSAQRINPVLHQPNP